MMKEELLSFNGLFSITPNLHNLLVIDWSSFLNKFIYGEFVLPFLNDLIALIALIIDAEVATGGVL